MSNDSKVTDTSKPPQGLAARLRDADSVYGSRQLEPALPDSTKNNEASWGDRWKQSVFKVGTYFGLNYVFNTLSSVAIAYVFEMKYDHKLRSFSRKAGSKIADITGLSAEKQSNALYEGTKGITLTMGGTMLVPVIKTLEDHRHAIEFKIGHALDVAQDKLGMGNISTQENLQEYNAIKTAIKTGKPVEGISDEAKGLIGKQHGLNVDCDGKLSFNEHKLSWSNALLSRLAAWGAAFGTNYTFSHIGLMQKLDESKGDISKKLTSMIPAYKNLKQPDLFSKNLANDAFLCVSSSVTQPFAQKVLNNKQARREAQKRELECPPDQQQPSPQISPEDKNWAKGHVDRIVAAAGKSPENHQAALDARRDASPQQPSLV